MHLTSPCEMAQGLATNAPCGMTHPDLEFSCDHEPIEGFTSGPACKGLALGYSSPWRIRNRGAPWRSP